MPYATNNGVRIYWEEEGSGPPLMMIMGLGFSMAMWRDLRPILAQDFRVILCDNRGVGKSDSPLLPVNSIELMAQDAACVLDAAGVQRAHLIGMSMGGMIAQELALRRPERVNKLILGCTNCGDPHSVRASPEVLRALGPLSFISRRRRLEAVIPFIYDSGTPRERVDADMAVVRRHPPRLPGYLAQLFAIVRWSSWKRLPQIRSSTLVIHGETDRLVPPQNGRILAERIPGAKLVMIPQASHIFPTDQPERTIFELSSFLMTPAAAER